MDTISLWQAVSERKLNYPSLQEEIEVDVAIIGGGITGLSADLHLVDAGKKVAVLEMNSIGAGTTGNSTGNLYVETQPYFQNIKNKLGAEVAKTIAHSRKNAIDEIEHNVQHLNIECNFARRPWYVFTDKKNKISFLDKEVRTLQDLGIEIDYLKELPLPFKFIKAATISNQARINPLQYVRGLAENLHKRGCLIFENTKVVQVTGLKKGVLTTVHGKVKARKIITATHTPIGIHAVQLFTAPYRSYVLAVQLKDRICPEGHFWGIGANQQISSTHSISTNNKPELLLVAGSHHKTGQDRSYLHHFKILENYLKKQIPSFEIIHQWSAQHYQAADDVPYIGLTSKSANNSYFATGFFADGLIYGTIAGKLLSNMILDRNNKLTTIYKPYRSALSGSIGFLLKENGNVFLQYLKDIPFKSKNTYHDLKPGEGRVVEINSEKCAISRGLDNSLHVVSAVCTHMKCIVNWNNTEKTWDCPCHGSRFSKEGKVIEGPAVNDLPPKNI